MPYCIQLPLLKEEKNRKCCVLSIKVILYSKAFQYQCYKKFFQTYKNLKKSALQTALSSVISSLSYVLFWQSCAICPLSSVPCHMFLHLFPVICPLSSVLCRWSPVICPQPSVPRHSLLAICPLSSVPWNLFPVICPLYAVIFLLPSIIWLLSSGQCHLSYYICYLFPVICSYPFVPCHHSPPCNM